MKIDRAEQVRAYEKELKDLVEKNTPEEIRNDPLIDTAKSESFSLKITKSFIEKNNLNAWLDNYRKEALVSTAGIRGPQNILYPWDTRFPIHMVGVLLATHAKAKVLGRKIKDRQVVKLLSSEVRYNSQKYVDLISRAQAAMNIKTLTPPSGDLIPIWMLSFLIYIMDLDGGEYVTSSHAVSTKTATKDLNDEGSQFLPEESMEFVHEIEQIFAEAVKGEYEIPLSEKDHALISSTELSQIDNGLKYYMEYLRKGVANEHNLNLINEQKPNLIVECVGGCMYKITSRMFDQLGILENYKWFNTEQDPFFAGIGKTHKNFKTGADEYFDLSCDISILDVAKTLGYETKLKDEPIGTVLLMTDPDGDRLILGQLEKKTDATRLNKTGIVYIDIDDEKVFTVYTPNQGYLMTMDYHTMNLKEAGLYDNHPRFIIKTTASTSSWDEWAEKNNIQVVNVPVGFKEIASIIRKVEKQIIIGKSVTVTDITGKVLKLGREPRMIFAGEESGGMITGAEEPVVSLKGRHAIAMREKSAGEAMIVISAMAAYLKKEGLMLSEYLQKIFDDNEINALYDVRVDITYYNESNPDPKALQESKVAGEKIRDKNDLFFLALALGKRLGNIDMEDVRLAMSEAMPELDFSDLEDISFVGDGTYMNFSKKFVEIRKSGTDAKTRAYSSGIDKDECVKYATTCGYYPGDFPGKIRERLGDDFIKSAAQLGKDLYLKFLRSES